MMEVLKAANLGIRFLMELLALGALGYWGFQTGKGPLLRALLGLGAPLLAAVAWGMFVSPKAQVPLTGLAHLGVELAVMGSARSPCMPSGAPPWRESLGWST